MRIHYALAASWGSLSGGQGAVVVVTRCTHPTNIDAFYEHAHEYPERLTCEECRLHLGESSLETLRVHVYVDGVIIPESS